MRLGAFEAVFVSDPVTLAGVGIYALKEGVKFLYEQAGELLKRWRARRGEQETAEAADVVLPAVAFVGELAPGSVDFGRLGELSQPIRELRAQLADYAQGLDEIDPTDPELLGRIDALRRALEAVFGQRITFKDEQEERSGVAVSGEVRVNEVLGYVAGIRARQVRGSVAGRVDADRVGNDGTAIGLDVDSIG